MDKLRIYAPQRGAVPRHTLVDFEYIETVSLPKGFKAYIYRNYSRGITYTALPAGCTITTNPTRYMRGNNYKQIGLKELAHFADDISEYLHTDVSQWSVSQFDFNADVILSSPPATYFELLGELGKWKRKPYATGVTYHTTSNTKALCLYDLHFRCQITKTEIPSEAEGTNKARVEASFNKALPTVKEIKHMQTFADYLIPKNYITVPKIWHSTYQQIEQVPPLDAVPSDLSVKEHLMLEAINKFSLQGYRQKIKADNPNNYRRQWQKLDQVISKVRTYRQQRSLYSPLDELNNRVREQANELIQSV